MLRNSFSFLPRIGEKTERRLWTRGIHSWDDYRAAGGRVKGVTPSMKRQHEAVLAVAEGAIGKDATFFSRLLPQVEHWRAFGEFGARAAYLDIESTGGLGGRNDITVVGVRYEHESATRTFVAGDDLTPESLGAYLADADMIVTFNGSTFDVPMIRAFGAAVPDVPHLDLRHALARLGYAGGLKKIEVQVGLARSGDVEGLSGYDAVLLWHRHELGDEEALPILLEYNRADVDNLVPLARIAYAGLRKATFEEACAHGRDRRIDAQEPSAPGAPGTGTPTGTP